MKDVATRIKTTDRPPWEEYWGAMSELVSTRATCSRRKVGCVIVRDNWLVVSGYNGAPKGDPHCTDVGCLMVFGHCVRSNHAEANAVASAARMGVSLDGGTAYINSSVCRRCSNLLAAAGVTVVISKGQHYEEVEKEAQIIYDAGTRALTSRKESGIMTFLSGLIRRKNASGRD